MTDHPGTPAPWAPWLELLRTLAPAPAWRQTVDWTAHALEGGPFPADYRAVVDVYGSVMLVDGPGFQGYVSIWSPLNPEGHVPKAFPDDGVWGDLERSATVGVSRSSDWDAFTPLEAPAAPFTAVACGGLSTAVERLLPWVFWTPPQRDGFRPLAVRSMHRPDVWVLAMSFPELLVRTITGTTGCPWLPPEPESAPTEVGTLPTPADDPRVPADGWAERAPWSGEVTSANAVALDGLPAVAIEILRPDHVPGHGLRTRAPGASDPRRPGLEELRERFPPPERPLQIGTHEAVEALLRRPLPEDLRELMDTYGAGSFVAPGGLDHDPPVHLLPAIQIASYGEEALDMLDVHDLVDLLGPDSPTDPRVAPFAVRVGGLGELWVWAIGTEHGIASVAGDADHHVWPLPGRAADVLRDALLERGRFAIDELDPPPVAFVPSKHPTNERQPR